MRILIIEDQENLAKLIKENFEAEGYAADYVMDGEAGQTRIDMGDDDYDIIILDLMLPKKDGLQICRDTRAKNITTPIIILTAKGQKNEIVEGLNAGADDYLAKPFLFEELLARIRAVLRRPKAVLPVEISLAGITIDTTTRKVTRNGKELKLTLKEYSLLEYLMRHPNQAMNREQIVTNLWDFAFDSFSNVVDVHVNNLRKKIGDSGGKLLETARGIGYRFKT
jgi:DNA-binding response OmpR family regulator